MDRHTVYDVIERSAPRNALAWPVVSPRSIFATHLLRVLYSILNARMVGLSRAAQTLCNQPYHTRYRRSQSFYALKKNLPLKA